MLEAILSCTHPVGAWLNFGRPEGSELFCDAVSASEKRAY